ncbi:hypothetical protein OEZ86_007662 [Tetradesmus obliquus]|nr:hypothetical protein OEZ86_007662 [Tetradesmus obliquus]
MLSDLQALGFENYMDAKEHSRDLSAADRAIVQLDSIAMVCRRGRIIPRYDLVVLDEVESTLHHATAKTHKERQAATFDTFCSIIKASRRVLAMDAFLGAETRAFFRSLQLDMRVVRNTWRPQPRTMVFTNDQQDWVARLVQALAAGQNVAVASMSANVLHSLKKHLVEELALLREDEVLLYDSAADDALKKRVQFVNSDWIIKRLPAEPATLPSDEPASAAVHAKYKYTELLPLLELDEHELLRSTSDVQTHHITCRGERDPRGGFFKVAEVARVLNRSNLRNSITKEESSFKAGEDYIYMPRKGQPMLNGVQHEPQIGGHAARHVQDAIKSSMDLYFTSGQGAHVGCKT